MRMAFFFLILLCRFYLVENHICTMQINQFSVCSVCSLQLSATFSGTHTLLPTVYQHQYDISILEFIISNEEEVCETQANNFGKSLTTTTHQPKWNWSSLHSTSGSFSPFFTISSCARSFFRKQKEIYMNICTKSVCVYICLRYEFGKPRMMPHLHIL